jgi:hypothetical protein
MKFPFTIFTLVFTMALSSTSFAEWTETGDSVDGATFYVDYERIREHEGYVYFWTLGDYSTRATHGNASVTDFWRGDCELFRIKNLQQVHYQGQMGQGEILRRLNIEDINWMYPSPNSINERILEVVCAQ